MPLQLPELNAKFGAPMGRRIIHRSGLVQPEFDLERVPMIDGGYDCGGAYFGAGEALWCLDLTTPLHGYQVVRDYIRAETRENAMRVVLRQYPDAKFKPEQGSIIEQTITFLQKYADQLDAMDNEDDDSELLQDVEADIDTLQEELDEIKRRLTCPA